MSKKVRYKFCVGRKKKHSSVFTITHQKNEIYVTSQSENNETKLSIHESGQCQFSYTSEYLKRENIEIKNADRHIMKMNLLPLTELYEIVCSYIIPNRQIVLTEEVSSSDVIWIDLPKKDEYVEIVFCRAGTINFELKMEKTEWKVITTIILQNGTLLIVMYRYVKMKEEDYLTISEAEAKIITCKKDNQIEERVAATVYYLDEDNKRYLMEVFV